MVELKAGLNADAKKSTLLRVTLLSSMGIFMDGYVLTIFSAASAIPRYGLRQVFSPTPLELGLMASAQLFGMLVGALLFGNLADAIGRRKAYIYDLSLTSVLLFITAFSFTWTQFFLLQALVGVGIGADYPISSAMQSEFSPTEKRGALLVFNMFAWTLGATALLVLAIPMYWLGPLDWRVMYASAGLLPLAVVLARRSVPESPLWLSTQAQRPAQGESEQSRPSFRELFASQYISLTLFSSIAWFAYDFSSYGVWYFTPSVFSASVPYTVSIVGDLVEEIPIFLGFYVCYRLVERAGRRPLLELGFLGAGISLFVFSLSSMVMPSLSSSFLFSFAAFALMHFFHNVGPTNLTYAYPAEIFPTRLRGTAHGFATAASRIGGILGTVAFSVFFLSFGMAQVLVVLAAFEFIGLAVTYAFAPEVKGKRLTRSSPCLCRWWRGSKRALG